MPTETIPYDPSLVLGMIVDPDRVKTLEKIAEAQKDVNAKRDLCNALLRQKLSLDMTGRELIGLGAQPENMAKFDKAQADNMKSLLAAASDLAEAEIEAEQKVVEIKSEAPQQQIGMQEQSPIDFQTSQLKPMPISADSMDMDVQYFRNESESSHSSAHADAVSKHVSTRVSGFFDSTFSASLASTAQKSVMSMSTNHKLLGTLVICANCTSRNAQIYSPLNLDADLAMEAFEQHTGESFPSEANPRDFKAIALGEADNTKVLPILSGVTYGSSFVGFVHYVQTDTSRSHQEAEAAAKQVAAAAETELFVQFEISGGVNKQSSQSLKDMMSNSSIQSHCSVITMGLIPSIKSDEIETSLKAIKDDPKTQMEELGQLQGDADEANTSIASGAASAKKAQQLKGMKSDFVSAAISAVTETDNAKNNVIDLNSLMTALDDYVKKAGAGKIGVPINFYIRNFTKKDVARFWMQKYYPDMLHERTMQEDDEDS